MVTYVMLTRLSPQALARPESVAELNREVEDKIKEECSGVNWVATQWDRFLHLAKDLEH
jgi:hypothetical protein